MLKIPHHYCRGYSRIHLRNESLSAMPLFGDFKVFPVLATRSDEQCLLKQNSNNFLIFVRFCPVNATHSTFLLGKDFHMPKVTAPPLWGEFLPYIHGQKKTGEIFAWWTLGLWITGSRSPLNAVQPRTRIRIGNVMTSVTTTEVRRRPPGRIFMLEDCVAKAPRCHSCHRSVKEGSGKNPFTWWFRPINPATQEAKAGGLQRQCQASN